ncbi:two-component system sensor histidine kinase NtrB [Candidatus Nitrospira bockiana]
MSEPVDAGRDVVSSEDYYRTLWNHAVDAKLIVDAAGRIRELNRRAELKLGRLREDLLETAAAKLFFDPDRPRFTKLLADALSTGKDLRATDLRVPTDGGAVLVMDVDLVPVENCAGIKEVLLQLSDVTEKRRLEQQLLRSERLASLSQFASMFAHDIRNPLAGIKKTLELLGKRPELHAPPIAQWFADLQLTTDLLLGMINDMLDVYQESYSGLPLIMSEFSVRVLFQEAIHLFRSEADAKGVSFRLEFPQEEIRMCGDRRRLQRVGINLLHNALKYSPPNGTITISVRHTHEGALPIGMGEPGDPVLLMRVEDEGPGIPPEDLPFLFEMFFRKKDGHDLRIGRGLGLHFCRLVVEAHHGRIWAANRTDGGAQFSMALPLKGHADADQPDHR